MPLRSVCASFVCAASLLHVLLSPGMVAWAQSGTQAPARARPDLPPTPTPVENPPPTAVGEALKAGTDQAQQQLPVPLRLGVRVARVQQAAHALSTVVVVPDARSYVDAIASWTPARRFPVLLDDGTRAVGEDIARFVRAYRPARVVHWRSGPEGEPSNWRPANTDLQQALSQAWDLPPGTSMPAFSDHQRNARLTPFGVVLTDASDRAWTAGLALAAGRGQILAFGTGKGAVDHAMSARDADALNALIEQACRDAGLSFETLGDDVEAVTLALNCAAKIDKGGNETLALTDRLGRSGNGLDLPTRWGWAGQVFGSETQAAYRAMCALFLMPTDAWLFDGYTDTGPWKQYDMSPAADDLRTAQWRVELLDKPTQGARDWRTRATRPVDAGLVLVNTRGNADFFDLEPGQCKPDDVPLLDKPAILHIIHSWSAAFPSNRDLLMGRWLERGVYWAMGSVHEPFLAAFVPPQAIVRRALAGAPLAAAFRHDAGQIWKVAVLGDPLVILHSPMTRSADAPPLDGTRDVAAGLREMLKDARYEPAFRALLLSGRDAELARLAGAVAREKPAALDARAAGAALLALARQQRFDDFLALYRLLDAETAREPDLRDALWLASYERVRTPSPELLALLRAHVRPANFSRDTGVVASAIARAEGPDAARAWLDQLRQRAADATQSDAVRRLMELPLDQLEQAGQ